MRHSPKRPCALTRLEFPATDPGKPQGFTLVELLVVIGIIAALIGILLPVLSGVASRGREMKCQANLRTIGQMFHTYAAENKGSLPYGVYYNNGASHVPPYDWSPIGGDERLTTCWSIISRMSGKQYRGDDLFHSAEAVDNTAPFLRCPEAELVLQHICSYVAQFTALITPWDEYRVPHMPNVQTKPAKLNDLLPFMILAYDTAVVPGMATDIGYVTGADVDNQAFWSPNIPQYRYYSTRDPFGEFGRGNNSPVLFAASWKNIDPPPLNSAGFNTFYYQGNLRFRHQKNTSVNVLYADGRVAGIKAQFHPDGRMRKHEIPRKAFMIKWPSGQGLTPNTGYPH